jgi:hypothetical protein
MTEKSVGTMDQPVASVSVTGTRSGMTKQQKDRLKLLIGQLQPTTLMHGDCVGADADAHEIARAAGLTVEIFPCDLHTQRARCDVITGPTTIHPIAKPLARNNAMVARADLTIAFPRSKKEQLRGSGTWQTVRRCRLARKRFLVVYPDGDVEASSAPSAPRPPAPTPDKPITETTLDDVFEYLKLTQTALPAPSARTCAPASTRP